MKRHLKSLASLLSAVPSLGLIAFLFLVPLVVLTVKGLSSPTSIDWGYLAHITGMTLFQAAASALLAGLIGTALALFYSESRSPLRLVVWKFGLICFSLPTVLVSLALIGFWSKWGVSFVGWTAIIVGHAFLNFPIYLRLVGNRLMEIDRHVERSALSLGANRWQCFWLVSFPRIWPALRGAFVLSFLYCSTSFVMILLLGGGPRYTTLEVAIYQSIRGDFDLSRAVIYALVQSALSGVLFFWMTRYRPMEGNASAGTSFPLYFPKTKIVRWGIVTIYIAVLSFLALGPLLFLVGKGLESWAWERWLAVWPPLVRSLLLAGAVACLSVLVALPLARFRTLNFGAAMRPKYVDWITLSPSVVSTLVLSLSWWLTYPFLLGQRVGGLVAVLLVQSLFALPLVYRALVDGYQARSATLVWSARNLGARPLQVFFWIELPVIQRAVGLAFLFGFIFSLGEVTSLILFSPLNFETLTWFIYRSMSRYDFSTANVAALILVMLIVMALWVVDWVQRKHDVRG